LNFIMYYQAKLKTEYQDQLARRRYEDQLMQQQRMQVSQLPLPAIL
jgi:hypothetical protein